MNQVFIASYQDIVFPNPGSKVIATMSSFPRDIIGIRGTILILVLQHSPDYYQS